MHGRARFMFLREGRCSHQDPVPGLSKATWFDIVEEEEQGGQSFRKALGIFRLSMLLPWVIRSTRGRARGSSRVLLVAITPLLAASRVDRLMRWLVANNMVTLRGLLISVRGPLVSARWVMGNIRSPPEIAIWAGGRFGQI